MQLTAPDDIFGTAEAAILLKKTPRQVQRLLKNGKLKGARPNGAWLITALSIWEYHGIEKEMSHLWTEACARALRKECDDE